LLPSPVATTDDHLSGRLVLAGAQPHRGLAPWCLRRHPGRRLPLAAAVWMVARVHHHAANLRAPAHMAAPSRLADVLVLVLQVADLSNRRHGGGHAELVPLPVDDAVQALLAGALVADRQLPLAVAAGLADEALGERLVRLIGRDLVEGRARHLAQARAGGSVVAERHCYTASKSSIFCPGAIVTTALRQPGTVPIV